MADEPGSLRGDPSDGQHSGLPGEAHSTPCGEMHPGPDGEARIDSLHELRDALRRFAADREWERFHSPKNLASALIVEAAELLEPFQWLGDDESRQLPDDALRHVGEELADVLLYLVRLADVLGIDLRTAALRKIAINARKYPAERVRGSARRHDAK